MKLLSIAFIFLCTFYYSNAQPVKLHGQLKVVGTQLTDQNNLPVVLNGMSFGWSCFHPRFYTASTVSSKGCTWCRARQGISERFSRSKKAD
jgi:endoglucanase